MHPLLKIKLLNYLKKLLMVQKKLKVGKSLFDWIRDWYGVDPTDGSGLL
jgi:hypothetical protein